jgi:hypothetical protein
MRVRFALIQKAQGKSTFGMCKNLASQSHVPDALKPLLRHRTEATASQALRVGPKSRKSSGVK